MYLPTSAFAFERYKKSANSKKSAKGIVLSCFELIYVVLSHFDTVVKLCELVKW